MQKELKEKLENLGEKYNKDIDLLSLKALCTVPENEDILSKISQLLEKISKKYHEDEEILKLLPNKEISIEELVNILEKDYSENIDFITLKAMLNLPESPEREKAIKMYLQKINNKDENIKKYLDSKTIKNPLMVFVEGGKYTPTFFNGEKEVFNLDVCKYPVTQEMYEKIMKENPSQFKLGKRPVENVSWWDALEFCNKLSEAEGLEPVYVINKTNFTKNTRNTNSNNDLENSNNTLDNQNISYNLMINLLNGERVAPELADFSKTEGYRLPTKTEWEWFARGGKIAQGSHSFDYKYSGGDNADEVGWFYSFTSEKTQIVGLKKANALGLYDCSGNVWEWCYDTNNGVFTEKTAYTYDSTDEARIFRGASWFNFAKDGELAKFAHKPAIEDNSSFFGALGRIFGTCFHAISKENFIGFRIVKTANPII